MTTDPNISILFLRNCIRSILYIFFIHEYKVAVSQCENATGGKNSLPGFFFIKEIHGPVSDAIYSASICLITNNNIQTQTLRLLRCFTMRIDTLRFRRETENCKTGGGGLRREKVVGIKVSGKNECLLKLQAFIYFKMHTHKKKLLLLFSPFLLILFFSLTFSFSFQN